MESRSIFAAKIKSLSVRPSILCVHIVIFDLSPSQYMLVTLLFSKLANLIHKCEGLSKVWKLEELRNVVFLNNLPPIHLSVQGCQRLALDRRYPPSTRDTGFAREIRHDEKYCSTPWP